MRHRCTFVVILLVIVGIRSKEDANEELERQKREENIMWRLEPCIDDCDFDDPECVRGCGMDRGLDFEDFLVQELGQRMLLEKMEEIAKAASQQKRERREVPSAIDLWRLRRRPITG